MKLITIKYKWLKLKKYGFLFVYILIHPSTSSRSFFKLLFEEFPSQPTTQPNLSLRERDRERWREKTRKQ
jgi:hypothetical protein